jgi:hypothetical protein
LERGTAQSGEFTRVGRKSQQVLPQSHHILRRKQQASLFMSNEVARTVDI